MIDILIQNIHQLNVTMQQNIDKLRDDFNQTIQNTHQLYQENIDQLKDEFNQTMQNTHQLNQQNIYQLKDDFNATMQIMQTNMDNYIASNDFTLKAINGTYFVVKTPLVIAVPSSDEIDHHRSKIIKSQRTRSYFTLRPN